MSDSDIRNCHYAGIVIGRGQSQAIIERCRISGSAWHGGRYDHASPTLANNLIFGNARCGIYASGRTAARVVGNVLWQNEMNGMESKGTRALPDNVVDVESKGTCALLDNVVDVEWASLSLARLAFLRRNRHKLDAIVMNASLRCHSPLREERYARGTNLLTLPWLFVKAFVAGGVAALPFGPMGVWCIRRTLRQGRRAGLQAAAGMATALGLWSLVVASGIHWASGYLAEKEVWLRLGLGIALVLVGLKGWCWPSVKHAMRPATSRWATGFVTTFCGVGSNPVTLVTLASVFAVLGVGRVELDPVQASGLLAGLVLGAMTLWVGLAEALVRLHRQWGEPAIRRLTRGLSGLLLVSGIGYLTMAAFQWP